MIKALLYPVNQTAFINPPGLSWGSRLFSSSLLEVSLVWEKQLIDGGKCLCPCRVQPRCAQEEGASREEGAAGASCPCSTRWFLWCGHLSWVNWTETMRSFPAGHRAAITYANGFSWYWCRLQSNPLWALCLGIMQNCGNQFPGYPVQRSCYISKCLPFTNLLGGASVCQYPLSLSSMNKTVKTYHFE